uniref:MHC class I-like antigen recognition-like domain-containing protein n=1 Tax=Gouania willdenowi TaxID=441366 RepID=A0A8C5H5E4_GOUWI
MIKLQHSASLNIIQPHELTINCIYLLHTMRFFYTSSSDVPNFPEFVAVGYVDDVQMGHYDINTRRAVPKQDWIKDAVGEEYVERVSARGRKHQLRFKAHLETLKQRFNQSGG